MFDAEQDRASKTGRNKQADVTLKARRICIFRKYISIALDTVLRLFGELKHGG